MDRFSNLPDNLIDLILEKLPINDKVKTSALSRSWRWKWTFISSLILDYSFYEFIRRLSVRPLMEYPNIINSLVLQHGGGLREFSLYIPNSDLLNRSLLQHSIIHVARSNSIMKLLLEGHSHYVECSYALPSSIFSAVNLRHLEISWLHFCPPSWFKGFPNLKCFVLDSETATSDTITNFVSLCPQLEKVRLDSLNFTDQNLDLKAPKLTQLWVYGKFTHVSVSNPQNLESISFIISDFSGLDFSRSAKMLKLFNSTTQLQSILLDGFFCKFFGSCSGHMHARFGQMKSLEFDVMCLNDPDQLRCLLSFCACCPNVRKLEIKIDGWEMTEADEPLKLDAMAEEYISNDLGHLVRVDLLEIWGQKVELKIIELLFRFSPSLELMYISFQSCIPEDAKQLFLKGMATFSRASKKVKVNLI